MPTARPPIDDRVLRGLAVALLVTAVPTALVVAPTGGLTTVEGHTAVRIALLAVATLPVAALGRAPATALAVLGLGSFASAALGWSTGTAALGLIGALAATAYAHGRRGALLAGVAFAAVFVVAYALLAGPGEELTGEGLALNVVVVVLALVTGVVLRGHHEALEVLAERNRRLEELRDVEKREAVATDRVRIARELHDIVGHALAAITLQARAGMRHARRSDTEAASHAFEHIEAVAGRALEETREVVGVLRAGGSGDSQWTRPTLADLPRLSDAVGTPLVPVVLDVAVGPADEVPAAVQEAAFRVAQEAVTNVVKHAGPATANVRVAREDGAIRVTVRDDGAGARGANGADGGFGLEGMRARVTRLGGTVSAGPAPDGAPGWLVDARIPLTEEATP